MLSLAGKRVTVAGLGHFGGNVAAAQWLVQQGARVLVTDKKPLQELEDGLRRLQGWNVRYCLGEHRKEDFTSADLIVASPAIPPNNQYLLEANAAGVPVTTEICLFLERCPARVAAVTGTKGKSTTTAMLNLMLRRNWPTHLGGNIGKSLLMDLPNIHPEDIVVLELSSFMLHYLGSMRWRPHVAVVTMIAPDHVEWHGDFDKYVEAKRNIVRFQKPEDYAVLNARCGQTSGFARCTTATVVTFGPLDRPFTLRLPGEHNQLNAHAAFAAAECLGITRDAAQDAIADFRGLPHRLELVHESQGVSYYNDSIATIPQAAAVALEAFPAGRVIQIVGGYDKGLDLQPMCEALARSAKAALCIGATGAAVAQKVNKLAGENKAILCEKLEPAMDKARELAVDGDIVLLSPGCASYGPFRDFEQRGEVFTRLARRTA